MVVATSVMVSSLRRSLVGGGGVRAISASAVATTSAARSSPASLRVTHASVNRRTLHTTSSRLSATPPPSSSPQSASARSNVSARPTSVRNKDLPRVPNTLPYLASFVILAIASWGAFTVFATNKEKLGSSIFKSVVSQIKSSPEISTLLGGKTVVLKRETYLGGQPRIKGAVNMMQGRVDLSFKVTTEGEERTATVYFTSIRAHKHAPFEILRFVVVDDESGESVSLLEKGGLSSIDVESGDLV